MEINDRMGIGANLPPEPEQAFGLVDELEQRHADKLARFRELTLAFGTVPAVIEDDEAVVKTNVAVGQLQIVDRATREFRLDEIFRSFFTF